MKNFFYKIGIIVCTCFLISNSAQPGVWNAGGSGSFTLLYPEDSLAYKKIQMQSEKIYMQLYKGFATVKGDYFFKNTTNDTLKIKVGYPINNVFKNVQFHDNVNEVNVDGLYKIQGFVNNQELPLFKKPNANNENWYVWEINFLPKKITDFSVYFLVNTNNAKIMQGYNSDKKNAFIYLIETGSIWKSPIEEGDFYTQLKDNISIKNTKASSPTSLFFNADKNILHFNMRDYGKNPDPNFVLSYSETLKDFNFKEITEKSDFYFSEIDQFSKTEFNEISFEPITLKNVYEIDGISNASISIIFYLAMYGVPIFVALIAIFIILVIIKNFRKNKSIIRIF